MIELRHWKNGKLVVEHIKAEELLMADFSTKNILRSLNKTPIAKEELLFWELKQMNDIDSLSEDYIDSWEANNEQQVVHVYLKDIQYTHLIHNEYFGFPAVVYAPTLVYNEIPYRETNKYQIIKRNKLTIWQRIWFWWKE